MKKRIVLLFSLIGLLLVTIVSTSFALFTKSKAQDGINQITTYNCLDISIEGENELNLTNAYPIKDEEGILQAPYLFTIKNNCDHYVGVDLGVEYQEESTISPSEVKATLNKPSEGIIPRVLSNYTKIQATDSETGLPTETAKYIMVHEGLPAGDEQTFEYRMWIDYSVENLSPSDKLKVKIVAIGTVQSEEAAPKNWYSSEGNTLLAALRNNNSLRMPLTTPGRQINLPTESVLASADDDYGTSFYYRGAVENNYVVFAGKCWQIVRITGDGSIKLILHNNDEPNCNISDSTLNFAKYDGINYKSAFNPDEKYNAYVGFMYGEPGSSTYTEEHANLHDSTILEVLKQWYDLEGTFSESQKQILADVIWCNDKEVMSGLGYGDSVSKYSNNILLFPAKTANPILICSAEDKNSKLSKYTAFDTVYGNGDLKGYKIGLLTASEAAYMGKVQSTNYNDVSSLNPWWLMSANDKRALTYTPSVWYVYSNNYIDGHHNVSQNFGVRPSIALISSVTITSGDGTINNPYIITN